MNPTNLATDPVLASVSAYSDHVAEYTDFNASYMADQVATFSALLAPEARILDAGCGPGRDLARFVELGHHPVGVDLNPDFVAAAGRYAPTLLGDLRDLPYTDDSFDGIWACASLVHLPPADAATALAEFARVARRGAPVCVSVKHTGQTGWADTAHGRRWFQMWEPAAFAAAVTGAGLTVTSVDPGPVFVDVWATA